MDTYYGGPSIIHLQLAAEKDARRKRTPGDGHRPRDAYASHGVPYYWRELLDNEQGEMARWPRDGCYVAVHVDVQD